MMLSVSCGMYIMGKYVLFCRFSSSAALGWVTMFCAGELLLFNSEVVPVLFDAALCCGDDCGGTGWESAVMWLAVGRMMSGGGRMMYAPVVLIILQVLCGGISLGGWRGDASAGLLLI